MSYKPEDMVFTSLDQISLFTVKMIKRIVKVGFGVRVPKEGLVRQLIDVVEFNLNRLNIDRKWYFHAIRDYSRVFQNEWDNGVENDSLSSWKRFNNVLIVVALKLGIEKLWLLDGCNPFAECTISELASQLYPDGTPTFALKYLDQFDNLFYYLAKHSPSVENVRMPFSNNENVFECVRLSNLRVIELGGGVADKVLCNVLWSIGNKRSEEVLEMAIKNTENFKPWTLVLPHLEVLRNKMKVNEKNSSAMRVALGAAALAIQPKMETVELMNCWGTAEAILHLLEMEKKKNSTNSHWQLNVTTLSICFLEYSDMDCLHKIIKVCPKLKSLELYNTKDIHPHLSLFVGIFPVLQVKQCTLDAWELTSLELTVLLAAMKNLEKLTLRLTLQCLTKLNTLHCGQYFKNLSEEDRGKISVIAPIKILVLEFVPQSTDIVDIEDSALNSTSDSESESILCFLSVFSCVREIYFRKTVELSPSFVVFGCIGGSLAMLTKLTHISVVSFTEDVFYRIPTPLTLSHFEEVRILLPKLQDDVTFKHLEKLKTIEIDEVYISSAFDHIIKALRLSGVCVSVMYRKNI